MKRVAAGVLLVLAVLVAVLLVRAATLRSRQVEVAPAPPLEVDAKAISQRLALALRYATISHQQRDQLDPEPFRRLHGYLRAAYPAVHRTLEVEKVNGLSLLYTWPGRDSELRPVLLAAHLDVVPIDPDSAGDWTHPPFEGVVEEGFVWGRGSIDAKSGVICTLEAVEGLIRSGFQPERTVYLAFGHDEEVGGEDGALAIAQLLAERGVELEWVLDEGGVIAQGFLPELDLAIAVIGVAEKGSVSIALKLEAPGGHSSVPPRHTAIGGVAAAVVALEANPLPGGIDGVVAEFLDALAPELPFTARVALANRWLFGPFIEHGFSRVPPLDAMLRTTTAVTIFRAGVKENVLPVGAEAIANFRIHPRDSIDSVRQHVESTVNDSRIQLQVGARTPPREASPTSPVDSAAFRGLQRVIRRVFPEVAAVPYLVVARTDARHYQALTENIYRFNPYFMGSETLELVHGTNERISVENLAGAVRFFTDLLQTRAGPAQSPSS